jgi:hypothetical protein
MEFEYIVKVKDHYEQRELKIEKNSDRKFFESLLLTIEEQLEIIKQDILYFFPDKNTNISRPKHDDYEIQKKIDKLVELRKININIRDSLKSLLQEGEFIICACGGKMYKTPINISFKKYGNGFIFPDGKDSNIKYSYICENCVYAIDEESYLQITKNLKQRSDLLQQGYNFVPNEAGLWHYVGKGEPLKKPEELAKDDEENYTYERYFEYIKVPYTNPITGFIKNNIRVKIFEKCRETGEITQIFLK